MHTVARAREFRELLRSVIQSIVSGQTVPGASLETINRALRLGRGFASIKWDGKTAKFERQWERETGGVLAQTLTPIAEAAVKLLTPKDLSLVRKSDNRACVLYFYDSSRNRSRRWCSMETCGNRMKVAAHYYRHRAK